MNSNSVVIGAKAYDPYVTACGVGTLRPTPQCRHPGLANELLDHLLTYLRIPYRIVPINDSVEWGDAPKSDVQDQSALYGTLAMVDRGEIDLTSVTWAYNRERGEYFDIPYLLLSGAEDSEFLNGREK